MRVALLTTDSREHYKDYQNASPSFGAAPEALLQGFRHLEDVEVHVVSCLQHVVSSTEKIGPNIWYHALHVPKIGWLRTAYQGCIRAVRKKLREIHPDIVHGQGTERECALTAALSGHPNVVTIHGNMAELARLLGGELGFYGRVAARLETFALRRTGGTFCNSAYTEELVRPRTRRTWRVPNAIRGEFFSKPLPTQKNTTPTLLNVGVISARKQQLKLLSLAEKMFNDGLVFEIRFVGQAVPADPYAESFLAAIGRAQRQGYARYLGLLDAKELLEQFDQAHGLVHIPFEEAFGLVVAEALARNLKFFGTGLGGIIDIASDAQAAELLPLNDWVALEQALRKWIATGCSTPSEAQKQMAARYHPNVIAQRHLDIYAELLSTRS